MDIKLACLNLAKDFSSRVFNLGIFPNHLEKHENKYPKGKWLWRCPEMPEKRKLACKHAQLGLSSVTDLHLHIWCSHAHTSGTSMNYNLIYHVNIAWLARIRFKS